VSKKIKQMEMDALGATFKDVRDLVVLSVSGLDSRSDNQMRLALRKKNIRMQQVKNSLTRIVFERMGIKLTAWEGPTTLAWGGSSIAELSREIDTLVKKGDKTKAKVKYKGAIADGQEVTFEQALKMPTRPEALGRVVSLFLSPAGRLVSQVLGPASQVAGQIKSKGEGKEDEARPEGEPAAAT
jgi:large subunit ribosomal protein L10